MERYPESDTTTFTPPDDIEQDVKLRDPVGAAPGIPRVRHTANQVWTCRRCGYHPNIDNVSPFCLSCGCDFYGNPGTIHEAEDKPPRAGLRIDGR